MPLRQAKRQWFLVALPRLVVGAEVLSLVATQMAPPNTERPDFPPMTMVWREAANYGINGSLGTQTLRLDHTDRCHQRLTLVGSFGAARSRRPFDPGVAAIR